MSKIVIDAGHEVMRVDDTSGNKDIALAKRTEKANAWRADYYVSIHHNTGINGGTGGGTIVFVYSGTSGKTIKAQ